MSLTIAYITSRKEPHFDWFWNGLRIQQIHANEYAKLIWISPHNPEMFSISGIHQVHPKPNVWSGPHRLTREDYFSAANARNTAAALCQTDWIAYVDDLSVLGHRWLERVYAAIRGNYIGLGTYTKATNLKVFRDGTYSYHGEGEQPSGTDTRLKSDIIGNGRLIPCAGSWLYGCSCVMPLEAILKVNGWPEALCDGMGSEDYCMGIVLQNAGYQFKFDLDMATIESEEDHHIEPPPKRTDFGVSPHDKSHRALEIAMTSQHFGNDFGNGMDLRQLRESVLAGNPFPIRKTPEHEWYSGKLLREL